MPDPQIALTAYELASRFVGVKEGPGAVNNPQVLAMLRLDDASVAGDSVPWCSAFVNYVAWLLRLPRSKSLAARSWLHVGTPIALQMAAPAFDVVVLNRGGSSDPAIAGPGHVGFFAGWDRGADRVLVLAGNQGDTVSIARFPCENILGVQRLFQ